MGERPDEIEQEIAETRSELTHNFTALEDKLKSYVDWRAQFNAHPAAFLALAFGGGAVLAAIFPARIGPRRAGFRFRQRLDDLRSTVAGRESSPNFSSTASSQPPDRRNLWSGPDNSQRDFNGEESFEGSAARARLRSGSGFKSRPNQARQNLDAMASAFLGVGVNRLARYIDSLLPGFHSEFEHTRAERSRETGWSRGSEFAATDSDPASEAASDPAGPTN